MLPRESIRKAKNFLNKTLRNFKFFLFGGYKELTRAPSLDVCSSSIPSKKMQHLDDFYREFCEQWDSDGSKANKKSKISEKGAMREKTQSGKSLVNSEQRALKNKEANGGINIMKEKKPVVVSSLEEEKEVGCSKGEDRGSQRHVLEQKMKELEMMDLDDEDHVLDIEEVLHYYSRLKSPVYQELVDKFFTDMYSEFSLPQPSVKNNTNMNGSMRRLGPLNI